MFRANSLIILTVVTMSALLVTGVPGQVANDSCATAIVIGDGITSGHNVGATVGPDPIPSSCGPIGSDVWYAYVASCTGTATASLCLAAGGSATIPNSKLTAWSGACGCLVELACNDNACGVHAEISFPVTAGRMYRVSVAGGAGPGQGVFNLALSCAGTPGLNDHCANAIPVTLGSVMNGTNVGATTGGGGAACAGDPVISPFCLSTTGVAASDVWFRLDSGSCLGDFEASTCSSASFDTVLAVWNGAGGCGNLTFVTCNDDNACSVGSLLSKVTFSKSADPYYISVAGFQGTQGWFGLLVIQTWPTSMSLAYTQSGPGTLGFNLYNGPHGGSAFTAMTLNPAGYPNGAFFGISITLQELADQIYSGYPFLVPLGPCGEASVGPVAGLPTALTIYGVSLGIPNGLAYFTTVSAPAAGTVP